MKYRWILPNDTPSPHFGNLGPILSSVLYRRGIRSKEEMESFLDKSLQGMHDPHEMKDIHLAVERVLQAIKAGEKVLIYGDYDADGVTSIAILIQFFRLTKTPCDFYIPHRIKEGYGLSQEGLKFAAQNGFTLIITVDTGINNLREIEMARQMNLDVIVTDHHKPPEELPKACAVLNPNRLDCSYPNKNLAGVGVAFKLVHACLKKMPLDEKQAKKFLKNLIDYVTLGTIADLVSLTGENRKLVATGLKQIANSPFPGIRILLEQQMIDEKALSAGVIAYRITPKLNASGRTDHSKYSAKLLIEDNPSECLSLYAKLDTFNRERQSIEEEDVKTAIAIIEESQEYKKNRVLVVTHPSFHGGVNGIVASKLVERYNLPAIVFSPYEINSLKGSARSIKGFSIFDCINACKELCVAFGGHSFAAGLTIEKSNFIPFKEKINSFAYDHFEKDTFEPKIFIDAILSFNDITPSFINDIKSFEPFGLGNPEPLFMSRDATLMTHPRLLKGKHVKFEVGDEKSRFEVIGFNFSQEIPKSLKQGMKIDLVYKIGINNWLGQERVQMEMTDFQIK